MEGRRFSLRWLALLVVLAIFLSVLLHYHFKNYITDYINANLPTNIQTRMKIIPNSNVETKPINPAVRTTFQPTQSPKSRIKLVPKTTDNLPTQMHKDLEIVVKAPTVKDPAWANMKTSRGTIEIMVYPKNVDTIVSASLLANGAWEPGELAGMERLFQCDPELGLVDIGANIGLYVLLGAKYGRHVVGVEPSMDNMARLFESVYRNHYQPYVTLIHNAISNSYTTMQLTANPWNRGNTVIKDASNPNFHVQGEFEVANRLNVGSVKTVLMDDLLPVVKFKRGVLKIDIEGAEPLAFEHSRKFLTQLNIPYVFMEWLWVKKDKKAAQYLYNFFTGLGFTPFQDANLNVQLGNNYLVWPTDVFWVKSNQTGPCKVGLASNQQVSLSLLLISSMAIIMLVT